MRPLLFTLLCTMFFITFIEAQSLTGRCVIPGASPTNVPGNLLSRNSVQSNFIDAWALPQCQAVRIRIAVHIIRQTNGSGGPQYGDAVVANTMLNLLNNDFAAHQINFSLSFVESINDDGLYSVIPYRLFPTLPGRLMVN